MNKRIVIIPTYNEIENIEAILLKVLSLNPVFDVLIVDEALSTGDAKFKKKSLEKIKTLRGENRAIILVSHALATIKEICNDVIWLDKGKIVMRGNPEEVVAAYKESLQVAKSSSADEDL